MGSFWFLDYWICERPCLRTSPKNFFSMGAIQGLSNNGTIERLNYLFWRTINAYWMIWPAIMKRITYRSEQASRTVNDTSMALWPVGLVSSYATLRERYLTPSRDLAPALSLLSGFSISQNTFESLWIREDLTKWVTIHEHYGGATGDNKSAPFLLALMLIDFLFYPHLISAWQVFSCLPSPDFFLIFLYFSLLFIQFVIFKLTLQ